MTEWSRKKTDTETTIKIETCNGSTNVTISSISLETGKRFAWDQINIPLKTLKNMVEVQ